jgi:hypothetical protein
MNKRGFFTLNANENKKFIYFQINLTTGDEVIVLLFYNENKQLIGKDRVVLGEQKKRTASTTFN